MDASQYRLRGRNTDDVDPEYEASPIEDVFGDDTRARVVTFLAQNTERPWHQKDIAETIDASQAMVSRVANDLEDAGIVERATGRGPNGIQLADTQVTDGLIETVEGELEDE